MKNLHRNLIRGLSLLLIVMLNSQVYAQLKTGAQTNTTGDIALSVQNIKQTSSTKLEFDAYLLDTEPLPVLELGNIQLGFLINSNISSGTLSVSIDNTSTGLNAAQQFIDNGTANTTIGSQRLIKLPGRAVVPKGSCTIISGVSPGTLLTHFIITSSVPFTGNSTPNLSFTSSVAVDPSFPTLVSEYRLTFLTPLDVNLAITNATVNGNPSLNVLPNAFTVIGNGSYCQGTGGVSVNLTNSEPGVTYTLYKNGNAQSHTVEGTGSAITLGNQTAGTYTVRGTNFGGTTIMNGTAVITETPSVPVSVTIVPSANNVCAGTSVIFTATPVGGGEQPTYQWYKNGLVVGSSSTYTDVNASNGDAVYVRLTSNAPCATGNPAVSNTVTLVVNPLVPASVTIAVSANNVCEGTPVTFTATPVGGGTAPTYQWFKNGAVVGTGTSFTNNASNGDKVYVMMTSNAICASGSPATSNLITMATNPLVPASVSIAVSANNVCEGTPVTFTATPVGGGTAPAYQWYKNGAQVGTGSSFIDDASNGEVVYVVMTSNATCATGSPATSNSITMTTIPLVPASVSIVVSANNVCEGTSVTFTATPVGGGTAPTYQWYENGVVVGTGVSYADADASNGEQVYVMMTSNAICASGSPAKSNIITMTTIPLVPASVTIAVSANNVCEGTRVTFTATPVGGGTAPTYQWFENGEAKGTGPTLTDDASNGDKAYVVMTSNAICASGSPATSNLITMVTNPLVPASVSIAVSANNVCEGTPVTFTATPVGGGTAPAYKWYENGAQVGTGSTFTDDASNGEVVYVVMTSNAICATGSPATSNSITMTTIPLVPASVSIVVSANNVCEGTSVTFTATPVGGGTAPTYQWYENGVVVGTGVSYTDADASNGEQVYVMMTSNAVCASGSPAKSNIITMTTIPLVPASVTIAVSANNVCEGTRVTFTATPVGGGTAPTYQWFENGEAKGTGPTLTDDASNGDKAYVVMTSNAICASGSPATSNLITMVTNPLVPASVSIAVSANNVCEGTKVTFTATPVGGGTAPAYKWYENGALVGTGSTFTDDASNGEVVYVVMTSNAICATGSPATSNSITMTTIPLVPASVSIVASANNVCEGTSVTFTATPVGGGTAPTYQWYENGIVVGTGVSYADADASNGEQVYVMMTSNAVCASGSPAKSNIITMTTIPLVPASVTIAVSANNVCEGTPVTFTATPVGGGTAPTYQWFKNGAVVGTGTSFTNNASNGDKVYVMMTSNAICASGSPATSNLITMVTNPLVPASVTITVSANNICEGTPVTFTAIPVGGGTAPSYKWYEKGELVGTGSTFADDASNGDIVYVVMTSNAICATGNPATSNSITMTTIPLVPASVSIVVSANNVCEGTSVTFTATPVGGGTAPTYQWYENGVVVGTGVSYTDADASNGEQVYVMMTSNAVCASGSPAKSNIITMTTNPLVPASVTIAVSANNVCEETPVIFTATPVGGGTAPTYQWYENGVVVGTGPTLADDASNGDKVYVVMTSNAICATGSPATSNSITMKTIPVIPAGVFITESANNVCEGTPVTFSAVPIGGGSAPTYQWYEKGELVGTGPTFTDDASNGDVVYVVMTSNAICATGSPATSNSITMTTIPLVPASVSIVVSANNVCEGTPVTFTATLVGGGTAPTCQWFKNDAVVGTGVTFTDNASNGVKVYVVMTSNAVCASGSPAKSNIITMTTIPLVPASVTIAVSANNVCEGTPVTFTATPVGGGTAPTYQWFKNGAVVGTGTSFTNNASNADVVYVVMTSNAVCASGSPATSNSISIHTNPVIPAGVSIEASINNVCEGTMITFTATPVGGGTSPTYRWYENGVSVGTDPTFTDDASNGDVVYVVMTSNAPCVSGSPATSNSVTIQANPFIHASVSIVASANNVCEGTPVTFTATPVGGGIAPTYQWYENEELVGTGATYIDNELSNGDIVFVVMTSNASPCLLGSPATSNKITMVINPIIHASVSIVASSNNVCEGTLISYTAKPEGGGTSPTYKWYENGVLVGTGDSFKDDASNGDVVYAEMTSNASPCLLGSPATSNSITVIATPVVEASVTIEESVDEVCAGTPITFTAKPVGGGSTPTYQWYKNSVAVGTGATFTDASADGDQLYVVMTSSATCVSGSPAKSNIETLTVNPIIQASVSVEASENPICKGNWVVFTAKPVGGGTAPTYVWYENGVNVGTGDTYVDDSDYGDKVYVVMTSNAVCATGSPATSNTITIVSSSVSIVASANNVCAGTPVTFTATQIGGGATPAYQWYKNTVAVGAGDSYTYTPIDGDVVSVVLTSSELCKAGQKATSNSITMIVNPIIVASVTLDVNYNPVVTGMPVTFEAHAQGGGLSPVYRWFVNNLRDPNTERMFTYTPVHNDEVYVEMTSNASSCLLGSPAISNIIKMNVSLGTSINQTGNNKISVYSINKNVFVNCMDEAKQILIYNSLGSLIKFDSNVTGLKEFDMSNLQSEYYFVKVITQYNVFTQRVLLK